MRADFLDRYSRLDSLVHRLPAAVKLLAAIGTVILIVLLPRGRHDLATIIAGALILVAALSRVPPRYLLLRLLLLEPFVAGVALMTLFQTDGPRIFLHLVVRSTLCLSTMLLLANTTPFADLLRVLRRARVPALLITTLALMYRYLFVLFDETQRLRRARLSRTFTRGRWRAWRSLGAIIAQLFVRSSERAERIYAAMCARGWK